MEPIRFQPLYFEKVWGGRAFTKFRDDVPAGSIGESWDIACHSHGMSVAVGGTYHGKGLDEIIATAGAEVLGSKINLKEFPLLVKLIHANEKLSVQVHPGDDYAQQVEDAWGKTEAWYVIAAEPGAQIVVGLQEGCTCEAFQAAAQQGCLEPYLKNIPVKAGDAFFIPSGLVHAIGAGIVIAEIQQSSDITYRVYDYNRGRELHVEKAVDVITLVEIGQKITSEVLQYEGFTKNVLCNSPYFSIELYDITQICHDTSHSERFFILTCVEGNGKLFYGIDGTSLELRQGDSILVPASLGAYSLEGSMKVLKSYVPSN